MCGDCVTRSRSFRPRGFADDHSHRPVLAPATLAALPSTAAIETRSLPISLAATHRGFAFYVALPEISIPDRDVFYVAEPLPSSIHMSPLLIKISKDFATIWTTIDPIGNVALFAGLTAALTRSERHLTALRATMKL